MQRGGLHLGAAAAEGGQRSCLWLPAACHAASMSVPSVLGMLTRRLVHHHSLDLLVRLAEVGQGLTLSATSCLPPGFKVNLSTTFCTWHADWAAPLHLNLRLLNQGPCKQSCK